MLSYNNKDISLTQPHYNHQIMNPLLGSHSNGINIGSLYHSNGLCNYDNLKCNAIPFPNTTVVHGNDPVNLGSNTLLHPVNLGSNTLPLPVNLGSNTLSHPVNLGFNTLSHPVNLGSNTLSHPVNLGSNTLPIQNTTVAPGNDQVDLKSTSEIDRLFIDRLIF